ncbi:MAG: polysaccharide export protein [Xanthomonadales bacterium]|nr:polysaccharide export protein [Xanthomonadales bacterium]
MKTMTCVALCLALFGVQSAPLWAQESTVSSESSVVKGYRLGPGDVVDIQVFGEEDLSPRIKLNEDGVFNYAFVGEFNLAGLTLYEAETRLDEALRGDYLVDPRVTVSVAEYRPFFIKGEVRSPGAYPFQLGLTVSRAITLAGGLTERASDRKIFLVSEGEGESQRRRVNLDDPVQPGDAITIEQSFF